MYTRINPQNSTFSSSPLRLVIVEKPSMSQVLAAVLGATQRKDGYLEGNGHIVSWCVGHLVQMAAPDAYDTKFAKWRRADLPAALKSVTKEYGTERVHVVLAHTVIHKDYDGRFSHANKEWAKSILE